MISAAEAAPAEGLGVLVVFFDGSYEAVTLPVDSAKAIPADLFERDLGEEPFHLVQPAA